MCKIATQSTLATCISCNLFSVPEHSLTYTVHLPKFVKIQFLQLQSSHLDQNGTMSFFKILCEQRVQIIEVAPMILSVCRSVCMCVCVVYACMHICLSVSVFLCICLSIYVCMCMCVCMCMRMCIRMCMLMCMCTRTYVYACVNVHANINLNANL